MSFLLSVLAWGLLATAVIEGLERWSRETPGPAPANVATALRDEQS
jgi:hypothetical protein